ncbi:MAG: DUF4363 family protein [Clostridium sp.]
MIMKIYEERTLRMKNSIISILLFICLSCFVLFARHNLIKLYESIETSCITIEDALHNNDLPLAYNTTTTLFELLQENSDEYSTYAVHSDFEILTTTTISLVLYIESKNLSDSLATVHILRLYAENMKKLQTLSFANIF